MHWRGFLCLAPLRPPRMEVPGRYRLFYRPNLRRRDLNSREATVLEAATLYRLSDCPGGWEQAMRHLRLPWPARGTPLRKDRLLWAAATEPVTSEMRDVGDGERRFEAVMSRLERDLPDVVRDP